MTQVIGEATSVAEKAKILFPTSFWQSVLALPPAIVTLSATVTWENPACLFTVSHYVYV